MKCFDCEFPLMVKHFSIKHDMCFHIHTDLTSNSTFILYHLHVLEHVTMFFKS